MERIGLLSETLLAGHTGGIKDIHNTRIISESAQEQGSKELKSNIPLTLTAPPILEEIERLKIIRKKYQSLEDTERCMLEWKSKGSLELPQFETFVLGEISINA